MSILLVVACALVDADRRVLIAQRPAGKSLAGLWEFPGGKIEPGETFMDAAIRELAEETTVRAEARQALDAFDVIVRDESGALKFHYVLVAVLCRYIDGAPQAGDDVHEAGWFAPADIATQPEIFLDRVAGLAARALG